MPDVQAKIIQFPAPLHTLSVVGRSVVPEVHVFEPSAPPIDIEAIRREAFEEGRLQGHQEGERSLTDQLLQQRNEFTQLQAGVIGSLQEALTGLMRNCENELVDLALETAHKLVGDASISREMVEAAVNEALSNAEGTQEMTVLLNRQDLELQEQNESPLLANDDQTRRLAFKPSEEVTRGGCIIKTQFGSIDARRETKFALLKESITG